MGYFNDKKSTNISKDAVERLSEICLDELMFSSDAYICMIAMNLQGYKRLHRYISKKLYCLYLDIQKDAIEDFGEPVNSESRYNKYYTDDIKTHLHEWNEKLENHLKEIGNIIKVIFEENGYIYCTAQKLQKILYKNLIKNERALKKFEDCGYSYEIIYNHDKYLHDKVKAKEKEYKDTDYESH